MLRKLGLPLIALALALSAVPAFAVEAASLAAVPAIVPEHAGCAPGLDLAALLSRRGETCPATAPDSVTPELMARPPFLRTCVCSCGQPCTTDADCGGARCGPGITCC